MELTVNAVCKSGPGIADGCYSIFVSDINEALKHFRDCFRSCGGSAYLFRDGLVQLLIRDIHDETAINGQDICRKVDDGDILLICSDAVNDVANEDYMEHFLINSPTPAEDLAEWAEEQGATGDVSAIAALIGGGEFGSGDDYPDDDGRFDAWA